MMLPISLSFINRGERDWAECFKREASANVPQLINDIGDNSKYLNQGYIYVLIHLTPEKTPKWVKEQWDQLYSTIQNRILWLIVRGGRGYPNQEPWTHRVHFLRYPLDKNVLRYLEIQACQINFIESIEKSEDAFKNPDWTKLYPPRNDIIIILLSLLSFSRIADVSSEMLNPFVEKWDEAYRQYTFRLGLINVPASLTKEDFTRLPEEGLNSDLAKEVYEELQKLMGMVPD